MGADGNSRIDLSRHPVHSRLAASLLPIFQPERRVRWRRLSGRVRHGIQPSANAILPGFPTLPGLQIGIRQNIALPRLHERLCEQGRLMEVLVAFGSSEPVWMTPGGDNELMEGKSFRGGNNHADALPMKQYGPDRFVDQIVQKPQNFRRCAAEGRHG